LGTTNLFDYLTVGGLSGGSGINTTSTNLGGGFWPPKEPHLCHFVSRVALFAVT